MIADLRSSYCSVSRLFSLWKQHYIDNKYTIFILVTSTISLYAEFKKTATPRPPYGRQEWRRLTARLGCGLGYGNQ